MPPRPLIHGSSAASANAVAIAASTALPPAASTPAPTSAAFWFCAATAPPRLTTGCLISPSCRLRLLDIPMGSRRPDREILRRIARRGGDSRHRLGALRLVGGRRFDDDGGLGR